MENKNFADLKTDSKEEMFEYEQRPLVSWLASKVSHSVFGTMKHYLARNQNKLSPDMQFKVMGFIMAVTNSLVEMNSLSLLERRRFTFEVLEGVNSKITGMFLHHPLCPRDSDTVLFYFHGGVFVSGSIYSHACILKRLMLKTHLPVYFMEYSLSPYAKFPTALNECVEVYEQLLQKYKKVIFVGDSAGGNLAATTTMKIIEKKLPLPTALVMMSPWLDLTFSGTTAETRFDHDVVIDPNNGKVFAEHYTEKENFLNPYVSPVFGTDDMFVDFPPTLIHVGDHEVLLDDSIRFARKLPRNRVRLVVWDNMLHFFQSSPIAESEMSFKEISQFICTHAGKEFVHE